MSKPILNGVFTLSGRRNRLSYLLYSLLWLVAIVAVGMLVLLPAALSDANPPSDAAMVLIVGVLIVVGVPLWISQILVGAQRCRDFGWTGWAILLCAIPYVGALFALAILFIPGTQGANRYGPDPLEAN